MIKVPHVLNSKGKPIELTEAEYRNAQYLQGQQEHIKNALGFEIDITTLTAILKRVVEQKFFELRPSEYMPVLVGGAGAWHSNQTVYTSYAMGDDFETGNINVAGQDDRLAGTDAGVASLNQDIINWAKQINWNIPQLKMAAISGNWDLVTAKEKSRKKNWDLGIQKIAFLGSASNSKVLGLLNQSGATINTTTITKNISTMSASEFSTLVSQIVQNYRANSNYTAMPTHFIMPEDDYNGLTVPVSSTYPNVSMLKYLNDAFKETTGNDNFQIKRCAYGTSANNNLGTNRYALLNYDEDSLAMSIPVDYTTTLQNTINGFQFQNVGYGQYTGVLLKRDAELLYFDHA
jgi:hypothetical protein